MTTATQDTHIPISGDDDCSSSKKQKDADDLMFSVEDVPPWYLCCLLGFQHYLTMFGSTLAVPLIVTPVMCIGDNNVAKSEVIGTIFFVSGIVTLLQSIIGCRLPIVQGATFSFLTPTFAILSLPQWRCPDAISTFNISMYDNITATKDPNIWQSRMREIQGSIMVASLFQVVIGLSGVIGLLLRFIGPLAITPTITLIGLALFKAGSGFCSKNWWVAIMTIVLIVLFSQYLRNVNVPTFRFKRSKGCSRNNYPIFKLFPVILGVCLSWLVCHIITVTNAIPNDPSHWAYNGRTDIRADVLHKAAWFRFPYPGQWGTPTVSVAGVFGMLAGVLASMIESVGDYYAAARLSGAPPPPTHSINRGILVEGVGCVLAGAWGTGSGTTSYSENIGAIGITKVGSRRVIQFGAVFMLILGMLGKFGALFVTIPDPIVGGMFMVMFGMISAVGLSNLQFVDLNSSRNLFILGFSLFFGLSMPEWMASNTDKIKTGSLIVDQILVVLLSTSMFVGGFFGFILDNTIPGTVEERGLLTWRELQVGKNSNNKYAFTGTYDFPIGMRFIEKIKCLKYIPVCPTFDVRTKHKPQQLDDKNNKTLGL